MKSKTGSAAEYFRRLSPVKGGGTIDRNSYSGKSGRCHCCPYGYHIDLDFVRYCQALNQGAKNDNPSLMELKRLKRERRRQKKSVEAMLGIVASKEEEKPWYKQQTNIGQETKLSYYDLSPVPPPRERKKLFSPPSPPPRKQSLTHPALRSPPPPDLINSSTLLLNRRNEAASDALQEAVLDFEELLESSKDQPGRRSRFDTHQHNQPYSTIDLLHHTPPLLSQPFYNQKGVGGRTSAASVARSNSLPRQFLHDSASFSRQPFYSQKEPLGMSHSYTNGYSTQSPMISDAMAALNAAQGCAANRAQDFDTLSIASGISGVSTTTLQSIRDQMATGLSRLKELEEEVRGLPSLQTKCDILREEKRILLEHVHLLQRGLEPPPLPSSLERDSAIDSNGGDLETRLESLRRFSVDKGWRRPERKRSLSPMRVNLQDFHSYRRARRGSLSEGSDTESVHSYTGRDRSGDRDDTRLYITEVNDVTERGRSSYGTPVAKRKAFKDAAVNCKVLTRDVGVSYVSPRSRSIGTLTDKMDDPVRELERLREIKPKPCLQCFKRANKSFESRSVGSSPPKEMSPSNDSSLSLEGVAVDDSKTQEQDSKNHLLQKLGKKSPIISRLSSPQLVPPALTFDNSTNTEPLNQRDQRLNTSLRMEDLFSREQLNELIADAKLQWESTYKSRVAHKEPRKPFTSERGMQTVTESTKPKPKPSTYNVSVSVKPSTRDVGIGYSSITAVEPKVPAKPKPSTCSVSVSAKPSTRDIGIGYSSITVAEPKAPAKPRMKSVACGSDLPFRNVPESPITPVRTKSIGVGDCKLTDTTCSECTKRKSLSKYNRSIGCGDGRITDVLCDKCKNLHVRSVGVGDARVSDDTCAKCKHKRVANSSCQVTPLTRSVGSEANFAPPVVKESLTAATTPEIERRPFGSSGVRVCDKCHEAITSVAKDIVVSVSGPSQTTAVISQTSKIPRLVEQPVTHKSPPKVTVQEVVEPSLHVVKEEPKPAEALSSTSSFSVRSEAPFKVDKPFKVEERLVLKGFKGDDISSSSSVVSSSLPSTTGSPQVKRVPYSRQETYTKLGSGAGGFVNPAFDERSDARQGESSDRSRGPSVKRELPLKPKREKAPRKADAKPAEGDAVIKGQAEALSSSSSSLSEDEPSLVGSSLATEELPSPTASSDTVGKPRKKAQPSRGMKAALKVLNDSIGKPIRSGQQLNNALNIIQKEWFKISSQKNADPKAVEEYMDAFEEYSRGLLQRVVNLSDVNGNTAMHYAVSHGNFDVVSVLLISKVCNINQQNKAGYTAAMLVALAQIRSEAHESVVKKLFESGDVNIKASQHGQTALMLAVSHGRLDMVRMLISAGANPNIQDEDGSTALMCAAEHGHLAIVRYLSAQQDADLYLMDNDGSTALTIAVEAGHKDVGVLLYKQMNLSRGSSPYSSVRGGKRPRTPTMARSAMTPPPRNSAPSSPGRSRKSSGRASPAQARRSSASLSNLNF